MNNRLKILRYEQHLNTEHKDLQVCVFIECIYADDYRECTFLSVNWRPVQISALVDIFVVLFVQRIKLWSPDPGIRQKVISRIRPQALLLLALNSGQHTLNRHDLAAQGWAAVCMYFPGRLHFFVLLLCFACYGNVEILQPCKHAKGGEMQFICFVQVTN